MRASTWRPPTLNPPPVGIFATTGISSSPAPSSTWPMRASRASPKRSTAQPSRKARTSTEMPPFQAKK